MGFSNAFRFPTDIRFGVNTSSSISDHLKDRGHRRPLFVTDQGVASLPFFAELVQRTQDAGMDCQVYSEPAGNPTELHVTSGVNSFNSHQADSVVIVGGGCALDVGKAIALMAHHPGELFDYEDDNPAAKPIDQAIPFMIAIPTTAGTGSEVGGSSVISDDKTHAKVIIWSNRLIPNIVLADPALTAGLPKAVTAATGIDALTHNIEAFLAKAYHPICEGIALEGIHLIADALPRACADGSDMEARASMLVASMMGAIAFQKGLGVTHSCAHALSTCHDLHHGLANGVMLVACMEFNSRECPKHFQRLAQAAGLVGNDVSVQGFVSWLDELRERIGIPKRLSQIISGFEISDALVDTAFNDACHTNNPIPCTREDFAALYQHAK